MLFWIETSGLAIGATPKAATGANGVSEEAGARKRGMAQSATPLASLAAVGEPPKKR